MVAPPFVSWGQSVKKGAVGAFAHLERRCWSPRRKSSVARAPSILSNLASRATKVRSLQVAIAKATKACRNNHDHHNPQRDSQLAKLGISTRTDYGASRKFK